ncbi:MAG: transcription termination/antitermination protein NusG [Phascolarctobacterium sp.]|jgi:transcriptional antiterminator NusG|nr:transcription termination/antitermination protein NusG [Phascolarctobacterium sp.]MBQ2134763.1 transcription termination/antitermination protein NusG [Phascolarctobacterium sp.]MBQ5348362.1 transcription termination/antitermination protein NusG [Phascolarctobacterium sp.]MBQ5601176.1 transcription termination/antitermination protein NusG [Phascolarctobacterium sp.]MBQ5625276.1 transcription termination/antitermination protein NusG [Phascolarctobacterium sp.]
MEEKRWYVIHTYSGYENKVSANLERKVHSLGMENEIFRIVIPMENEVEIKDGKKRSVQRKVFPGYVLVEMIVNDRSWYAVRNTPGVTGFVGSGSKPIPLTDDEVRQIMRSMGVEESRPKIDFQLHQLVRLKTGPFADCLGKVSEINEERGKLKVLVDMFGRETPVEIDFTQVEEAE